MIRLDLNQNLNAVAADNPTGFRLVGRRAEQTIVSLLGLGRIARCAHFFALQQSHKHKLRQSVAAVTLSQRAIQEILAE